MQNSTEQAAVTII